MGKKENKSSMARGLPVENWQGGSYNIKRLYKNKQRSNGCKFKRRTVRGSGFFKCRGSQVAATSATSSVTVV